MEETFNATSPVVVVRDRLKSFSQWVSDRERPEGNVPARELQFLARSKGGRWLPQLRTVNRFNRTVSISASFTSAQSKHNHNTTRCTGQAALSDVADNSDAIACGLAKSAGELCQQYQKQAPLLVM